MRFSMVIYLVIRLKPLIWWETRRQNDEIWSSNDRRSSILTPSSFTQETGLSTLSDIQNVMSEIEPFGLIMIDWNLEMLARMWLSPNHSRLYWNLPQGLSSEFPYQNEKRLGCYHLHSWTRDKHHLQCISNHQWQSCRIHALVYPYSD